MRPLERVEMMLEAIAEVKAQYSRAEAIGDELGKRRIMGNLIQLEASLVNDAILLVEDVKKAA